VFLKRFLIVGVAAITLSACTLMGKDYAAQLAARQQAYAAVAGAAVNSFHYTGLWSWEPLSDTQLAVYTQASEAWLLDLKGTCRNLRFTNHIGLTADAGVVSIQLDRVLTGPGDAPCVIKQIRSLDLSKLDSPLQGHPREVEEAPRPHK